MELWFVLYLLRCYFLAMVSPTEDRLNESNIDSFLCIACQLIRIFLRFFICFSP